MDGWMKGRKEERKERRKEGNKIFLLLSINQTESQQNLNMKCNYWSWARSYSIQLNMFLVLKKLTTNVDAEMDRNGEFYT